MSIIKAKISVVVLVFICFASAFDVRRTRSNRNSCFDFQFLCDDSLCQPYWKMCNGKFECADQTDELPHLCANRTCDIGQFACGMSGQCIRDEWRCDGEADCSNGQDEVGCERVRCQSGQFKCAGNGHCISDTYVCDFQNDCGDNSDEQNCQSPTCSDREFTCLSGECITKEWLCDNDSDCRDGSDEMNCV